MKKLHISVIILISILTHACKDTYDNEPKRGIEIFSISPEQGKVRDIITIKGKNFKPINTNVVLFADNIPGRIVSFSENEIQVMVPDSGVVTGPLKVRVGVNEIATSAQTFTIDKSLPVIFSVSPNYGLAGTEITIKGANFIETGNKVYFDMVAANIIKEDEYNITVELPQGLPDGEVDLVIESNGAKSEASKFEVGIIFRDNFNRVNSSWINKDGIQEDLGVGWAVVNGEFQIQDGRFNSRSNGVAFYRANGAEMISGDGNTFRLSMDYRIRVAAGSVFAGIMFNAQDNDRFYVLRMNGDGLIQFLATADGGVNWPGVFFSEMAPLPGAQTYQIEVYSDTPGTFQFKVSNTAGNVLFDKTVSDPSARYTGGYAGVWGLGDHSDYDNFSLLLK